MAPALVAISDAEIDRPILVPERVGVHGHASRFDVLSEQIQYARLRIDGDDLRLGHGICQRRAHVPDVCAYIQNGIARASQRLQNVNDRVVEISGEVDMSPDQVVWIDRHAKTGSSCYLGL